ncbi:glycoside hydrolase family protein [Neorhodopirellula lusitana]|uniref:hypothetical protein n=1 Tax=Neorhodopirellula lusitana TaxID=445327 RepID=UPI00384FFF5D
MMKCTYLLMIAAMLSSGQVSLAEYQAPDSLLNPKQTLTIGTGKYSVDSTDDSAVFQRAIDDVHESGGGHVVVPAGDYQLIEVNLKSDVHLLFESGVTIRPFTDAKKGRMRNVFNLGMKDAVKNVSVVGPEDRVIFDCSAIGDDDEFRAVCMNDCNNFRIANLTINDNFTKFSSITLGWGGVEDGKAKVARNGLIENITADKAHYGYGAIQAHSGESIVFRNIKSTGGVGVRLETGSGKLLESGIGGLFDIKVEDVTSINGQGALMFQPHTIQHGDVVARNIHSDGSEFCVYIAKPYVSKKKLGEDTTQKAGSFRSIKVDGVKAIYRDGPIVTRSVHFECYPVELHKKIVRADNGTQPGFRGPSIAAVANMRPDMNVSITHIEAIGFKYRPDTLTPNDLYHGKITNLSRPKGKDSIETRKKTEQRIRRKK